MQKHRLLWWKCSLLLRIHRGARAHGPHVPLGHTLFSLGLLELCCSVLQCVAVCCSMLQYVAVCPLSRCVSLSRLHPPLPISVTIVTITVTKNILFSHQELKTQHIVICLYVYKRTRQSREEQQVQVVVQCGRAGDGAVS